MCFLSTSHFNPPKLASFLAFSLRGWKYLIYFVTKNEEQKDGSNCLTKQPQRQSLTRRIAIRTAYRSTIVSSIR